MPITLQSQSASIRDTNLLCQQYLHLLYQGSKGHLKNFSPPHQDMAETYGEILYPSIDKLLANITLTQEDTFVDLGSGLGKLVIYIFLQSKVKLAYGIEIIPRLHQQAMIAAEKCQQQLPQFMQNGRELKFFLASFLDMSFAGASVALVSSPCFSPSLLGKLSKIIDATDSIHTVFSFRSLNLQRLHFKKAIRIECSWDTTLCYLYTQRV